jgi:hypothetical protein
MKRMCEDCKGTGLTFPLCDSDCKKCGATGQVAVESGPRKKDLFTTVDGRLATRLCDLEDCTDWEAQFADSIHRQVESGRSLTEKQVDKCREILERYQT